MSDGSGTAIRTSWGDPWDITIFRENFTTMAVSSDSAPARANPPHLN